jgi:hypothetical protein
VTTGASTDAAAVATAPLVARTVAVPVDSLDALVDLLPAEDAVAWLRHGEGLSGWGRAAAVDPTAPHRFVEADDWWRGIVAAHIQAHSAQIAADIEARNAGVPSFSRPGAPAGGGHHH